MSDSARKVVKTKCGEIYFAKKYLRENADKSLPYSEVSAAEKTWHTAKGRLQDGGKEILQKVIDQIKEKYGVTPHLSWNVYCGDSTSPSMPGFVVKAEVVDKYSGYRSSNRDGDFKVRVDDAGKIEVKDPYRMRKLEHIKKQQAKVEVLGEFGVGAKDFEAVCEKATVAVIDRTKEQVLEIAKSSLSTAEAAAQKLTEAFLEQAGMLDAKIEKLKAFTPIIKVEVDGKMQKLSKPAAPFFARTLKLAKMRVWPLLVGPTGCGKTVAAEMVAGALDLEFGTTNLTEGASESWLFGRMTPQGFVEGLFSKIYRLGGVFLADELDCADPNMLLAINTALANGHFYNPVSGKMLARHKDFIFIGGANTVGKGANAQYTGRNRLDSATLSRMVVVKCDYSPVIEQQVCPNDPIRDFLQSVRGKLKELNSGEIICTRRLNQTYLQRRAGIGWGEILESLTAGWPTQLVEQTGMRESDLTETLKNAEVK